ncbi:MAG: hypothetical protein IJD28_05925 [Deferribacterales bacterium]|nr:hypothetical protein [Deferribacterales bacterium]
MRYLFFIIIFVIISGEAFSKEMIFYKYADGDGYSHLVASADEAALSISVRDIIARKMIGASFFLENVPSELYSVEATKGIAFFGDNITQYKITPHTADRFSHIVWVDDKKNLIKTEIYDLSGKLMFALSNIDFAMKKKSKKAALGAKKDRKEAFFKGFRHEHTKTLPGSINHLTFTDGLNRLSVFINPNPESSGTMYKIYYGNYLMSKVITGVEYTIIGSVTYPAMEEFIEILSNLNNEIGNLNDVKFPVSHENIQTMTKTEEILK